MKTTKKEIAEILKATFPGYSGRKFAIEVAENAYFDRLGGGGSWDELKAVTCVDGKWIACDPQVSAWNAPCGTLPILPEYIIAAHTFFRGTSCGIRFYINPKSEYLPKARIA